MTVLPTEPGLYADIDDHIYHDSPALSSSGARKLLKCPAQFRYDMDNPEPPSAAFTFGSAAHALVLGVGGDIVRIEAADYRGKEAREQRDRALADHKIPLLADEFAKAVAISDAVMDHPTARAIFESGVAEQSGIWVDEETGATCRYRPDWITTLANGRDLLVDLKTSVSADPKEFASSVAKFGYHFQEAWYRTGAVANGMDDPAFLFVVAQKTPPYPVSIIELHPDAVALGARMARKAIDLWVDCCLHNRWPAYGNDIHQIDLPKWAYYQEGE